jgi:hypothetical protein
MAKATPTVVTEPPDGLITAALERAPEPKVRRPAVPVSVTVTRDSESTATVRVRRVLKHWKCPQCQTWTNEPIGRCCSTCKLHASVG